MGELGKGLHRYMNGMKRLDTLPYYAVTFEQPLGDGLVRRGTIVSQSPFILRQWLDQMAEGFEAPYLRDLRFPTQRPPRRRRRSGSTGGRPRRVPLHPQASRASSIARGNHWSL